MQLDIVPQEIAMKAIFTFILQRNHNIHCDAILILWLGSLLITHRSALPTVILFIICREAQILFAELGSSVKLDEESAVTDTVGTNVLGPAVAVANVGDGEVVGTSGALGLLKFVEVGS